MESVNLQEQFVGSSSSLASCFGVASTDATAAWTPNCILNNNDNSFNPNLNGVILNSTRDLNPRQKNDLSILRSPYSSSSIQDLGFHQWANNTVGSFTSQQHPSLQFPKLKEELSDSSASTFICTTVDDQDLHLEGTNYMSKDKQKDHHHLIDQRQLLGSAASGDFYYPEAHNCCTSFDESMVAMANRRSFNSGQNVFPSINISNLNSSRPSSSAPPAISTSMEMNLEALDLLTSPRFGGSSQDNSSTLGLFKENGPPFRLGHPTQGPLNNSMQMAAFREINESSKRSFVESKASQAATTKKLRSETRTSCPPFKVRKEKLGDRISALQQLVAPFGKTDTASVLMEAIGYIKFLQNQVEALSVPYMRTTRNRASRTLHGEVGHVWRPGSTEEDGKEEGRRDLRSRGLCLVPLSCMSYMTSDASCGGQGLWPPQSL